jgi:hypothetical protein
MPRCRASLFTVPSIEAHKGLRYRGSALCTIAIHPVHRCNSKYSWLIRTFELSDFQSVSSYIIVLSPSVLIALPNIDNIEDMAGNTSAPKAYSPMNSQFDNFPNSLSGKLCWKSKDIEVSKDKYVVELTTDGIRAVERATVSFKGTYTRCPFDEGLSVVS